MTVTGRASSLLAKSWALPGVGIVRVMRPSQAALRRLDEQWSPLRTADDIAHGWEWAEVWDASDVFLLVAYGADNGGLAIWRAERPLVILQKRPFYRLDNIEVGPANRGASLGRFVMTLVASRACELGAEGIVLAAPMERVRWYDQLGAVDAKPLRWKHPGELKARMFEPAKLKEMKEVADALENKK